MYLTVRFFKQCCSIRIVKVAALYSLSLLIFLALILLLSLVSGSYPLSFKNSFFALLNQPQWISDPQAMLMVWEFRLPRSLAAIFGGALFSLSGALLQNLTRNPLADPSLVGISQGSALAVVILALLFPDYVDGWREIAALFGAVSVAFIIQYISGKGQPLKFILLGIGVAAFISAITSALLTYGDVQSSLSALSWLAGSVHAINWQDVSKLCIAFIVLTASSIIHARTMSPFSMGADISIGLGVVLKKMTLIQLSMSVGAAAIATAVVGPLGFVGLLAPHLARKIVRSGPVNHLLLTVLIGASLVLLADLIGRTLFAPIQLAAGLVTSLVGAPLFAYLLIRKPS